METRKLYYEDCHLAEFTAQVLACKAGDGGYWVILDRTAFYPGGGGQACDTGSLGEARVLSAKEQGAEIWHLCDCPLEIGAVVAGRIDYARRFDLMQQHTGEHIVSGLLHARYGCHNVGFHMGADVVTIDFDYPIPAGVLPEIQAEANRIVWENRPVEISVPAPEVLEQLAYRTKRTLAWPVRIVEIPGVDRCACCGIQVERTGEVGLVKLFSCVKFREGVRIEMACGGRALEMLSAVYAQNQQVSQAFSAKPLETGAAARRMNDALAAEKFRAEGLLRQVFAGIAAAAAGMGDVLRFEADLEPAQARQLADDLAEVCGGTAAVFTGSDEAGYRYSLVTRTGDLRELGKTMTQALKGRGGGKPNFQQGSVAASREEIRAFFQAAGFSM